MIATTNLEQYAQKMVFAPVMSIVSANVKIMLWVTIVTNAPADTLVHLQIVKVCFKDCFRNTLSFVNILV